jgi:hypothetical protein
MHFPEPRLGVVQIFPEFGIFFELYHTRVVSQEQDDPVLHVILLRKQLHVLKRLFLVTAMKIIRHQSKVAVDRFVGIDPCLVIFDQLFRLLLRRCFTT